MDWIPIEAIATTVSAWVAYHQYKNNTKHNTKQSSPPKQKESDTSSKTKQKKPVKVSTRGVDYTKLENLLESKQWKKADYETAKVMLQAAGRESKGWLDIKDIKKFPCKDLETINNLWVYYSDGKFGFSVQKKIYENLGGGTKNYQKQTQRIKSTFCNRIGWRKEEKWVDYHNLTFNLTSAPSGHLPSKSWVGSGFERDMTLVHLFDLTSGDNGIRLDLDLFEDAHILFGRTKTCNL